MSHPTRALEEAENAETIAMGLPSTEGRTTGLVHAWWLQSEALTRLGRPRDARPIAQHAINALGDDASASRLHADVLISLGRSSRQIGEFGSALASFQRAFEIFREIDQPRGQAIALQAIGSIYNEAHQFERAIEYYIQAYDLYRDRSLDLSALNYLANAFRNLQRYEEARGYYERALASAEELQSAVLQVRILNNLATLLVSMGRLDDADAVLERAFAAAEDIEGAEWERFLWGVRAQTAWGRGDLESALAAIQRTFDEEALTSTTSQFTDFHAVASEIFEEAGIAGAGVAS